MKLLIFIVTSGTFNYELSEEKRNNFPIEARRDYESLLSKDYSESIERNPNSSSKPYQSQKSDAHHSNNSK